MKETEYAEYIRIIEDLKNRFAGVPEIVKKNTIRQYREIIDISTRFQRDEDMTYHHETFSANHRSVTEKCGIAFKNIATRYGGQEEIISVIDQLLEFMNHYRREFGCWISARTELNDCAYDYRNELKAFLDIRWGWNETMSVFTQPNGGDRDVRVYYDPTYYGIFNVGTWTGISSITGQVYWYNKNLQLIRKTNIDENAETFSMNR